MAATRSRQLLLDVYSSFIQADKASSLSASTALPALAKELAEVTGKGKDIFGADDVAKKDVESWLSRIDAGQEGDVESLEKQLESRTYLAGATPTAADVALLGSLYPTVSSSTHSEQYAHPSVSRYISHLSHLYSTSEVKPWEPAYEGMPALQRKDPVQEKKEKSKAKAKAEVGSGEEVSRPTIEANKAGAKAGNVGGAAGSLAAVNGPEKGTERQQQKKEKKEKAAAIEGQDGKKKDKAAKAGGGGGAAAAAASSEPATPSPAMIDLRVGKIVDIQKHPDADSLYLEKVDFGEADGPRTVLSGLVNFVPIEEMKDRWVVGICNLKPQAMRGIKSYAMLLCATAKEGKEGGVEPIYPPEGSAVGDRIEVEGYEGQEPLELLNPKKKIFEAIQPSYITTESKQAAWVGPLVGSEAGAAEVKPRLLKTTKGVCYAANFAGATLS